MSEKSSKYDIIALTCQSKLKTYLEDLSMSTTNIDNNSLAHTSWNCKYHIVFAPKYRRKVFFEEKRVEIREILRQLCQWKFQKYGNIKFAYRNREFWCKGYYVDTVGKNTKAIKEYIADQLKRDRESDQ